MKNLRLSKYRVPFSGNFSKSALNVRFIPLNPTPAEHNFRLFVSKAFEFTYGRHKRACPHEIFIQITYVHITRSFMNT